ncbi:PA14 domain-containing protein [Marinobacter sp. HL-58]|uniref:PA14 domain-containing protein n=1 Tax=Marinobacter sp. HL-58 TaxID=1479237 RepID=UPI000485DB2F|nr:PA14 domain-containing protein [Marinobacter sp. HL-58]KPQ01381.1 MAG: PA14 domain/Fibronectin type III domain [Marinobacter sp. HL-58]
MAKARLLGLAGFVIVVSGCQSWQIGDVESLPPTASLPDTSTRGRVELRLFEDIPGSRIKELLESPKYPDNPDEVIEMTSLEMVENRGDKYGALARGFIVPPVSGDYTFFVSGDDQTQLWLSTDSTDDNLSLIASVTGYTTRNRYNKYSSQTSPIQSLSGGNRYYFEVRFKEGLGDDHFSVAWQGPGISQQVIGSDHIYSLGKPSSSDELATAEAYSLGYRVGFLDGTEALAFNPEFPPLDEDRDGIYDNWEVVHGLDPTNPDDALSDPDNDLIVAADEFLIGTAENNPDTDGDGIPDGMEYAAGLDPIDPDDALGDLDGDGFTNLEEYSAGTGMNDSSDMPETEPVYSTGFVGQYFTGTNFDEFVNARHDSFIDFNWGRGKPFPGIPEDEFSVRWSGEFTAPHTNGGRDYRFTVKTDDGNRLYLDDKMVIDDWSAHSLKAFNHTATMQPGETVGVTVEFFESRGAAIAEFSITDLSNGDTVSVENTMLAPNLNDSHSKDSDGDGIPDTWELRHGLNPWRNDALEIVNSDGVSNREAYNNNLNPWTLEPAITASGSPETTDPETSQPEAPAGGVVILSWTPPGTRMDGTSISLSEIDYYEIQYGQNSENLTENQPIDGAETSYEFNNLSPGTWYFTIRVVDTNGLGSPPSEIVSHEISE